MQQGSAEWKMARCGSLGASRLWEAFARTKSGWGASRYNLMSDLLVERLTGVPLEGYINDAMRWGSEKEPDAKMAYSFLTDQDITDVGIIMHPTIYGSHASPDGFVSDDGLIEVKCPQSATHIDTLLGADIVGKYITQMQWQMACTRRKWCDYVSYDPRLPESMRLHVRRVERDDVLIAGLEQDVAQFLEELDNKEAALRKLYVDRAPEPTTLEQQAATLLADANERGVPRFLARGKDTPLIMGG